MREGLLMLRILCTLVLCVLFCDSKSQKKVKAENRIRIVEFYHLDDEGNLPFFKFNQELPELLLEALKNRKIKAFDIDYNQSRIMKIRFDKVSERLAFEYAEEEYDDEGFVVFESLSQGYYLDREASRVGIDLTQSVSDPQIRQINFINLYLPGYLYPTGIDRHVASFRFKDVRRLLDKQQVLWYDLFQGLYWRNSIFSSYHGTYVADEFFGQNLVKMILDKKVSADSVNRDFDLKVFLEDSIPLPAVGFKLSPAEKSGSLHLYLSREYGLSNAGTFLASVSVDELQKISDNETEIYMLSQALAEVRLVSPSHSTTTLGFENDPFREARYDTMMVGRNGRTMLGEKDKYSKKKKLKIIEPQNQGLAGTFEVQQMERIYADEGSNHLLFDHQSGMPNKLIGALSNNTGLSIYRNDSLIETISREMFLENLILPDFYTIPYVDESEFDNYQDYENRVEVLEADLENRKNQLLKSGITDENKANFFSPDQVTIVEPFYKVTFNHEAREIKSVLLGINLVMPAQYFVTGIEKHLGTFDAKDMEQVFGNDPDFMNLLMKLKRKEFTGYFMKASHISPVR